MDEFQEYVRTNIAEMRGLNFEDTKESLANDGISISKEDLKLDDEAFSKGKIARNPQNHKDQWYINAKYVSENFKLKD